ncbi:MAG: 16S rRNA (cytosine(1402)-N(4))-methyltransferase RsmH [Kiritimatiellae bacterium]|nr:16S rRNA (cytosine(1402)-N(4))-methyltransferase RsmH [Kiritimatiellia bacterium]
MHVPVLLKETVDLLAVKRGGVYVDGTLGRAGHAREILLRGGAGTTLVGIDRDCRALEESSALLKTVEGVNAILVHGRHGDMSRIVREEVGGNVDGVLLDLGVSSPQLDEAERGFSFRADGPLDMRMDQSAGATAAELIAKWTEDEIAEVLRTLGEEPNARRIARAIVKERSVQPIETTGRLAGLVERTIGRRGAHHPATRTFQALRMAVNDELGELGRALDGGIALLKDGGRFAVITFESLTDRLVKRCFAAHAGRMVSLQQGGERWDGELPRVRPVTRRAVTASDEEICSNPRSRSAKLRVVERIAA